MIKEGGITIKVNVFIDTKQNEHVEFHIHELTPEIQQLIEKIQNTSKDQIWGYLDYTITPLLPKNIIRFVTNNERINIQTKQKTYHSKQRIYQWAKELPHNFIQISSSEIINFNYVDHLELTNNGSIKLILINQSWSFVSRRYLHQIRKKLGI